MRGMGDMQGMMKQMQKMPTRNGGNARNRLNEKKNS